MTDTHRHRERDLAKQVWRICHDASYETYEDEQKAIALLLQKECAAIEAEALKSYRAFLREHDYTRDIGDIIELDRRIADAQRRAGIQERRSGRERRVSPCVQAPDVKEERVRTRRVADRPSSEQSCDCAERLLEVLEERLAVKASVEPIFGPEALQALYRVLDAVTETRRALAQKEAPDAD